MRLPKRPETHIIEAESWRLLQSIAPKNWIVREITERDYGIDCYIEMCGDDGEITGDLISVQLKGIKKAIDWNSSSNVSTAQSPSIRVETANYWNNLPVPVFLFVADISSNDIYYISVEEGIRNQYDKLLKQDSISFKLVKELSLSSDVGVALLSWFYNKERNHNNFVFHVTSLLSHIQPFGEFIRFNQNRDCFMEVESEQHLQFRAIYETCRISAIYLENEWGVESLSELYKRDREEWKDRDVYLHEKTLDYALQKIEKVFPRLARKALKLVTDSQSTYWSHKDPVFYNLCYSGEFELSLKRIEEELSLTKA